MKDKVKDKAMSYAAKLSDKTGLPISTTLSKKGYIGISFSDRSDGFSVLMSMNEEAKRVNFTDKDIISIGTFRSRFWG